MPPHDREDLMAEARRYLGHTATAPLVAPADEIARSDGARTDDMPDAETLRKEAFEGAVQLVHRDPTKFPQYPWQSLKNIAGPMVPGDLIMAAARTGGGKSLFLQNLFDHLIFSGRSGLYVGLEQKPDALLTKWACLRTGVMPKLMLAAKDHEYGGTDHQLAMYRVQEEFKRLDAMMGKGNPAQYANARRINAQGLKRWTEWAAKHGCEFVMVDHIDRVDHGDGRNSFHEMSRTIRLAKELAQDHNLVMLLASQVGRPGDKVEAFLPVQLHELRGGGTKEEECDTVLGIYRPLKPSVSGKDLKNVRLGLVDKDTLLDPGTMGVEVLKHRLDGEAMGKKVRLEVFHGRVNDIAEKDRWQTSGGRPMELI